MLVKSLDARERSRGCLQSTPDDIIWEPYGDYLENSNVRRLMDTHGIASYDELVGRSTSDVAWFWDAALKDLGVQWDQPYHTVLDESRGFPWARWFLGGKLNIARNCLERHASGPHADHPAVEWVSEGGERATTTYAELERESCRVANAMKLPASTAATPWACTCRWCRNSWRSSTRP